MITCTSDTFFATLRELGEWAALGFYEAEHEPWPGNYGRAYRRLYENMDVVIYPDRLLVPCEPLPHAWNCATHKVWTATGLILDFDHNAGLRVSTGIAEARKKQFPQHAAFIDELCADLWRRLQHFGGYTHSNPDIRRVVNDGFLVMDAELDVELLAVRREMETTEPDSPAGRDLRQALNLFLALKDYTAGVRAFHGRIGKAVHAAAAAATGARQAKLAKVASAWDRAFLHPAASFLEGLLAVNMAWMLDGHDSIGRFDQALGPLFEKDIASGALDLGFARELLDEVWGNFERFNGWNLQIGGYTPEGKDGFNPLTRECIDACARNHHRRPNVAFRITKATPDAELAHTIAALAGGSGRPALYNDDLYTETLFNMDLGLTREDSREIGFGGCTETMIAGMSNVGSLDGEINLARCLVRALYDGYEPAHKSQEGPHTGHFADFATFDQFLAALKRQITWATDEHVGMIRNAMGRRFTAGDPKLYRTFFTRDCVKNRKSFEAGGARYNWSVVSYQGIANLIDSAYAIRRLVFEEKKIAPADLIAALDHDFDGYEPIRQLLKAVPKFGNDIPAVDDLGRDLISYAWNELYSHNTRRGGRFLPSCILFVTYYGAGLQVSATPDGRKAGEVLTDSVGPAQGRDLKGPTAMLNSVAKLPLALAAGTPILNLRFLKQVVQDEQGREGVVRLVRTFFAKGGMQVQISVLDREEMLAAQRQPDKHRDLIVRIGGYSEYFVALPKALQDSVIARTEYAV